MLTMNQVLFHCGGDQNRRTFCEGSAIYNSGFLLECRIKKKLRDCVQIFALCLQNSNLSGRPHEITIDLNQQVSIIQQIKKFGMLIWLLELPLLIFK